MNTGAEPAAQAAPPRRAVWTVFVCLLVAVLEGFDLQIMGVTAPQVRAVLRLSPEELGWTLSASLIGLALGAVFGGWLADRFGRKPVLVGSVLAFGVFTFASAYAPNLTVLFVTRFATGLGLGGAMPNMIALVAETVSRKRITTAVSIMFCGAPLGGIALALLARMEGVGWRDLFMIGGALPILVALVVMFGLAETHASGARKASRANVWSVWFGGGFAPSTLLLWVVFALTLLELSLVIAWLPSLAMAKGYPPTQAFIAPLLFNVGSILGAFVVSWSCDRLGYRIAMPVVYAGAAAAVFFVPRAPDIQILLALSLASGLFIMGAQFALYGLAPKLYPDAVRGAGVGGAVGVGRIGAILGPILMGQMLGAGFSFAEATALVAPGALVAAVAILLLTFTASERLRKPAAGEAPGAAQNEAGRAA